MVLEARNLLKRIVRLEQAGLQNAGRLKGKKLDDTGLANNKIWAYNSTSENWELVDLVSGAVWEDPNFWAMI